MSSEITCPHCKQPFSIEDARFVEIEAEVAKRLDAKEHALISKIRAEAAQNQAIEQAAKNAELAAANKSLEAARTREAEFLRQKAELTQKQQEMDLELQRKLDAEREKGRLESAAREEAAMAKLRVELAGAAASSQAAKDTQLAAANKNLEVARARETEVLRQKAELELRQQEADLEFKRKLEVEREKFRQESTAREQALTAHIRAELMGASASEQAAKDAALTAANKSLEAARSRETELLRQKAELDQKQQEMDLELQRKMDAERARIRQEATQTAVQQEREQTGLKMKEKELLVDQLKKQLDDMQRKVEQGSMQVQGEVQELVLEEVLAKHFPKDRFAEVGKGVEGADVVQVVVNDDGQECGKILWESKRTKNFSKNWLPKLREDQQRAQAVCAALVSQAMPEGVPVFEQMEGVWVCAYSAFLPMAMALRTGLIETTRARMLNGSRETDMSRVYDYITSDAFRLKLQSMSEAFTSMQESLDGEKKAMVRIWNARQEQINKLLGGVSGITNDLLRFPNSPVRVLETPRQAVESLAQLAGPELSGAQLVTEFKLKLEGMGGSAGNVSLREVLAWDEATYERVKAQLVGLGQVAVARGRGGSVRLVGTGEAAAVGE